MANATTVLSKLDFCLLKNILPSSLKLISINPLTDLRREDESDDSLFYTVPRFVHHIDDRARDVLSRFYFHSIKQTEQSLILDICSSWTSHLPENFVGLVHGLGMNEAELKHNPSLKHGYTVQDLNKNSSMIQFPSNTFDAAICSVSIDYLIRPLEVFNEVGRILKPNCPFITAFSDRCFPTKVIGCWLKMNEQKRIEWIANYFLSTGNYFDPTTIKAYSFFDNEFLPSNDGKFRDPMYVVLANKRS